ncbi:unnamed protein product [Effrenium voratum]|uniref:Aminoglycoside phosphotransferase domain-containing protein n=1 Tax=Effrenium voratum TaxID=2562239 RepID=A0AA36NC86_9DINO|nr:unnamed protein product [Effrenium voratum]
MDASALAQLLQQSLPCYLESGHQLQVTASQDTEWHHVYFVDDGKQRVAVSIPSWTGTELLTKVSAEEALGEAGVGPAHLATINLEDGKVVLVNEFLEGGTLSADELSPAVLFQVGQLYGKLHSSSTTWFEPLSQRLVEEGTLELSDGSWAAVWNLWRFFRMVPDANRREMQEKGVDWDFLADEIRSLSSNDLLPSGLTAATVCVHGDAHLGNIMWHKGELRLIDFDMTLLGPAGFDLAYLVLMLFRCGFSREIVASMESQRQFAQGYLQHMRADTGDDAVDQFLFDMHRWAYVGMIQMGLLCAVLMHQEGNPAKRQLMQMRGPVLLHPEFLSRAKDVIQQASLDPKELFPAELPQVTFGQQAVNLTGPPPPQVLRSLAPPEDGSEVDRSPDRSKELPTSPVSPKVVEELATLRWENEEKKRTVQALEEMVDLLQTRCRELEDESRELMDLAAAAKKEQQTEAGVPNERREGIDHIASIKERQLSREPIASLGAGAGRTERDSELERLRLRCEELEEERMHLAEQLERGHSHTASESSPRAEDLLARCERLEAEKEKLQKHVERLWQMCQREQGHQGRQASEGELTFEAVVATVSEVTDDRSSWRQSRMRMSRTCEGASCLNERRPK